MRSHQLLYKAILIFLILAFGTSYVPFQYQETMERFQDIFDTIFGGYYNERGLKNSEFLASLEQTGHFDPTKSPLLNNPYNITQIKFKSIATTLSQFRFPNTNENSYRPISGIISLPKLKKVKGIVLYFFPATLDKSAFPSARKNKFYRLIAALYAIKGFPVVFFDYLGMGLDSTHVHPYLFYPQQQVTAGIYVMNSALNILNKQYGNRTEQNPWPLMAAGYSEGANYAVWFSICSLSQSEVLYPYCNNDNAKLDKSYKIMGVGGMNGIYDLKGIFKQYLFSSVGIEKDENKFKISNQQIANQAKPGLAVFSILGLSQYSKNPFEFSSAFTQPYRSLDCPYDYSQRCEVKTGNHYNLALAFSQTNIPTAYFARALGYAAFGKENNGVKYTSFQDHETSSENNLLSILNESVLEKGDFYKTLEDASSIGYGSTSPHKIFIFSLKKNSVISPLHSINFAKYNSSKNVFSYFLENEKFEVYSASPYKYIDHVVAGEMIANIFTSQFFSTKLGL